MVKCALHLEISTDQHSEMKKSLCDCDDISTSVWWVDTDGSSFYWEKPHQDLEYVNDNCALHSDGTFKADVKFGFGKLWDD